jgi:hypothetical protein
VRRRRAEDHAESRNAVAWVFSPAQNRQHVFDVRSLKKLQPAKLYKWNVAPNQLPLEWATMMRGAEKNSLRFECEARLAVFQDFLDCVLQAALRPVLKGLVGSALLRQHRQHSSRDEHVLRACTHKSAFGKRGLVNVRFARAP